MILGSKYFAYLKSNVKHIGTIKFRKCQLIPVVPTYIPKYLDKSIPGKYMLS